MTRFERRFLARIARNGGLVLAGLTWLVVTVYVTRRLDGLDPEEGLAVSASDLALLLRFLDVALGISTLIGAALAITDLRRLGVLASFCAAGMPSRHLLRPILLAATFVLVMSTLMHEGFFRLSSCSTGEGRPAVWRHGSAWIWAPGGVAGGTDIEPAFLFSSRGLAVSVIDRARWDPETKAFDGRNAAPLAGTGIAVGSFPPPPAVAGPFQPASILSLFAPGAPAGSTLTFLDRLILAPLLIVVTALAVLLGATRRFAGLAALSIGIPLLILLNVVSIKLLWTDPTAGIVAQAVFGFVAGAALIGPIVRLRRQGPRSG